MKKALLCLIVIFVLLGCLGCNVPSKKVRIYFFKDGNLATVDRVIPTIEDPLMIAITELMKGPTPQEKMEGYTTEIPAGARARRMEREGDVAIIDFNRNLAMYEGPEAGAKKIIAQIVYTATDIRKVKYAYMKLQSSDYFELGSDNYVIDHPLERSDAKF